MPPVVAAVSAISSAFAATAVGSFLTTTVFGRILTTVLITALRRAISKPRRSNNSTRDPGIRTSQTQTGGTVPASFILGRYATDGVLAAPTMSHTSPGSKTPNNMLTYVIDLGDVPGQALQGVIVDGVAVPIGPANHPQYGQEIGGRFQGKAWVKYYNGSQTAADPMLRSKYGSASLRPWTSTMIGHGICYAIMTFSYDREIFAGFPRVRFIMDGIPLYDPRADSSIGGSGQHRWNDRSSWELTNNPMVMIYNILRGIDLGGGKSWGGRCEADDLPLARWFAAMNACDLDAERSDGGLEPAYRAGYEVYVDDEPASVIEELLKACSGEIAEVGGRFIPRVGPPALPVYFFTDDDVLISDPWAMDAFPPPDETFNTATAVYPDPDALWESREAPERVDEAALAEDGAPLIANMQFDAVPYAEQVQRLMRADLADDRRFTRHTISLPSDAIPIEPLDAVAWTSKRHNYVGKVFEVTAQVDPIMTGSPRLALRERDSIDFNWTSLDAVSNPAPDVTPIPAPIPQEPLALDDLDPSVRAAVGINLLTNTDFADGLADWLITGSGPAFSDTSTGIQPAGQPFAGQVSATFRLHQISGETNGSVSAEYRPFVEDGLRAPGAPCASDQWIEVSVAASISRCGFSVDLEWTDASGTVLERTAKVIDQPTEAPGSPDNPLAWPRYFGRAQAPLDTAFVSMIITKPPTDLAADPAESSVYFFQPQLAITVENAAGTIPYHVGGSGMIVGDRLLAGSVGPFNKLIQLPEAHVPPGNVIAQLDLGPRANGDIWHIAYDFEYRSVGDITQGNDIPSTVLVQYRNTAADDWITILEPDLSFDAVWIRRTDTLHWSGIGAQSPSLRLLSTASISLIGVPQANIRNVVLSAEARRR